KPGVVHGQCLSLRISRYFRYQCGSGIGGDRGVHRSICRDRALFSACRAAFARVNGRLVMEESPAVASSPLGKKTDYVSVYTPSLLSPIARSESRRHLGISADA